MVILNDQLLQMSYKLFLKMNVKMTEIAHTDENENYLYIHVYISVVELGFDPEKISRKTKLIPVEAEFHVAYENRMPHIVSF